MKKLPRVKATVIKDYTTVKKTDRAGRVSLLISETPKGGNVEPLTATTSQHREDELRRGYDLKWYRSCKAFGSIREVMARMGNFFKSHCT